MPGTRPRAEGAALAACIVAALAIATGACAPAPAPPGREVRDGLGRSVTVPVSARRVVTLAPSVTETVLTLGLGGRLAGVGSFCQVPEELRALPRVGGLLNPDLETIRSLRPDLLIGTTSGNDPGLASQAEALGLPLYILHTPDVDSVLGAIEQVADLLGEPALGTQVAGRMRARLATTRARVSRLPPPRVLFVIWSDPLVVPGAGAFLTDAVTRAGGASVTADIPAPHPTFSIESAVALKPEVILTTADNAAFATAVRTDPLWAGVPAVRSGRVHVLGDGIVRPGPGVIDGIEEMARALHPESPDPGEIPQKQ